MGGENLPLATNEAVELEKYPVPYQDIMKTTNPFRDTFIIFPNSTKKIR
jgi:hypothetical protein